MTSIQPIFPVCLCLSVLVCVFSLLPVLAADPVTITPVWIHDGDTFQAHLINKAFLNCRIWGIDAPELDQPWGKVSKSALIELIHQRKIKIQKISDSYSRTVVTVHLSGRDIALELIKMGLAWHDPKFSPGKKDYAEAQKQAQKNKIGLWSDKYPVPPWEWRKKRKE